MESQPLRILPATEADIPALMSLQYAACEDDTFHNAVWGANTAQNRLEAGRRLAAKWRNDPYLHVMKCVVERDEGDDAIMAFCLWDIFERERSPAEIMVEDELQTCDWLAAGRQRDVARAFLVPAMEARREYMAGRPYCLLTNLCTDPLWQRKGAAMALVRWGLQRAEHLGIPALLEASEEGLGVYVKLGFEKIGMVRTIVDGQLVEEYPLMVKWATQAKGEEL